MRPVSRTELIRELEKQGIKYRETHCRACGEDLDSLQDETCEGCGGLVCSCGECFC